MPIGYETYEQTQARSFEVEMADYSNDSKMGQISLRLWKNLQAEQGVFRTLFTKQAKSPAVRYWAEDLNPDEAVRAWVETKGKYGTITLYTQIVDATEVVLSDPEPRFEKQWATREGPTIDYIDVEVDNLSPEEHLRLAKNVGETLDLILATVEEQTLPANS